MAILLQRQTVIICLNFFRPFAGEEVTGFLHLVDQETLEPRQVSQRLTCTLLLTCIAVLHALEARAIPARYTRKTHIRSVTAHECNKKMHPSEGRMLANTRTHSTRNHEMRLVRQKCLKQNR